LPGKGLVPSLRPRRHTACDDKRRLVAEGPDPRNCPPPLRCYTHLTPTPFPPTAEFAGYRLQSAESHPLFGNATADATVQEKSNGSACPPKARIDSERWLHGKGDETSCVCEVERTASSGQVRGAEAEYCATEQKRLFLPPVFFVLPETSRAEDRSNLLRPNVFVRLALIIDRCKIQNREPRARTHSPELVKVFSKLVKPGATRGAGARGY